MAKDRFYRSKPHVNVGAIFGLRKLGLSDLGAIQVANSQPVANPRDRKLAAEVAGDAASGLQTGKRQHKPVSATASQKPLIDNELRLLGFSNKGIQQLTLGLPMTGPNDLGLLCEVLMELAREEYVYFKVTLTN